MDHSLLNEKTAVITGGASGIGRAIAIRYAEHGADVVIADIRNTPREGGTQTHELIESKTESKSKFVECDVTEIDDLVKVMNHAKRFGGVDIMVNNAGIFLAKDIFDITENDFDRIMDINAKGTFFGSQIAAKQMKNKGGVIINMSSTSGLKGRGGWVPYCASKGAIKLMTYALADALGPFSIRVNAIHPGLIETMMQSSEVPQTDSYLDSIPSGRAGTPGDVADVALYLASPMSDYINGESITVDGGTTNT